MCTVSVIPPSDTRALRAVVNRDERRTRSVAWAPQVISRGDVPVIAPVDSESLGTWVAATGAGLVYALLNLNRDGGLAKSAAREIACTSLASPTCFPDRYAEPQREQSLRCGPHNGPVLHVPRTSRGHVIPALAAARDHEEASRRFRTLDIEQFGPFRLIITDAWATTICQWDGARIESQTRRLDRPIILSSSSLGDDLVEAPRRALFDELLAREADQWRAQDRLHQHSWPERRHLSVLMSRDTARTVSRTVVVMDQAAVRISYAPVIDDWIGPVSYAQLSRVRLPLAAAG